MHGKDVASAVYAERYETGKTNRIHGLLKTRLPYHTTEKCQGWRHWHPALSFAGERAPLGCSVMNEPAQKQQALRRLYPEFSESGLENLARYFDLALEIAGQGSAGAEPAFDIPPAISTLKERSSSNLKDQS